MLLLALPDVCQAFQAQRTLLGGKFVLLLNSLVDLFPVNAVLFWSLNTQPHLLAFDLQNLDLYIIPNRDTFP